MQLDPSEKDGNAAGYAAPRRKGLPGVVVSAPQDAVGAGCREGAYDGPRARIASPRRDLAIRGVGGGMFQGSDEFQIPEGRPGRRV